MEIGSPIFAHKDPRPGTRLFPPSPSLSSIPFSWEQQPGIPKFSTRNPRNSTSQSDPLPPLPPPLRSAPDIRTRMKLRDSFGLDPFELALAECTKSKHRSTFASVAAEDKTRRRRRTMRGLARGRSGLMGALGSCKSAAAVACSVSESVVYVPRSGSAAGCGLLNRRFG